MKSIPFLSFDEINSQIEEDVFKEFESFYHSKRYILGDRLLKFEKDYAGFSNTKHAIGVNNGLNAIYLSLLALGIGQGDEVILPSNTFIASVLAVTYTGATPVFSEPNPDTHNICPKKIQEVITNKTKAILPVHLYGQSCEMDKIMSVAKVNRLFVVEDNAQAQGATCNGVKTGSFGDLSATSFYPGKNLGAFGDAGAVTTDDDTLSEKIRMLRNYGSLKKYHNEVVGFNARLDELQAGFLSIKLRLIDQWSEERNKIAGWYNQYLKSDVVIKPQLADGCTSVYHLYVIRHPERDRLQHYLEGKGVATLIHYPIPPHLQKAYAKLGYQRGDFPIAEKLANEVLSLPLFIGMKEEQVAYICNQINKFPHGKV